MSLYPISTACPKCGATAHQVCKTGSVEACDERWIAAGAHVIDSPTTNPETAGVEPVAYVSPGQLAIHKDPEPIDPHHSEAGSYLPVRKTQGGQFTMPLYTHPAPASNTTSVGEDCARLRELEAAASPGPWEPDGGFRDRGGSWAGISGPGADAVLGESGYISEEDIALIVYLRNLAMIGGPADRTDLTAVNDRVISRLKALHDYAGRPAWDDVLREELTSYVDQIVKAAGAKAITTARALILRMHEEFEPVHDAPSDCSCDTCKIWRDTSEWLKQNSLATPAVESEEVKRVAMALERCEKTIRQHNLANNLDNLPGIYAIAEVLADARAAIAAIRSGSQ